MRVAGFVLAGGRSSRMGQDKAMLPWGSTPLICHVAGAVLRVCGTVAVLGPPEKYGHLGLDCLPDLRPGLGPLAGIETALVSGRGEHNLVLACDMPDVPDDHLQQLLDSSTTANCVVTKDESGRIHPLCAVYRDTFLAAVEEALDAGQLRLLDLVAKLAPVYVHYAGTLRNLNQPEDCHAH